MVEDEMESETECFDAFVRCDAGLCRSYPSTLVDLD